MTAACLFRQVQSILAGRYNMTEKNGQEKRFAVRTNLSANQLFFIVYHAKQENTMLLSVSSFSILSGTNGDLGADLAVFPQDIHDLIVDRNTAGCPVGLTAQIAFLPMNHDLTAEFGIPVRNLTGI